MKIENKAIFMGDATRSQRHDMTAAEEKKSNHTVFAGDFNSKQDLIAQKKQRARAQAMKIVGDAFEGDCKIDTEQETRRNRVAQLKEEIGKARKEVNDIEAQREALRESYGVEIDSKEEQDLKLLEKEMDAKSPSKQVFLSKEEKEEIARIKAEGLTEYQQRSLEMKEFGSYYESQIYEMELEMETENAIIKEISLERLKNDPMANAQKQADAVMEAAGKEIIGMLTEEAREHIDEELEEKKEAADKKAEEEKELEEKLEKAEEKREEQEEFIEEIVDATEEMVNLDTVKNEVQDEVQKILDKMKLLEEDIKGAAVDETL